jgi:trk system potassium uptake protein TrkH
LLQRPTIGEGRRAHGPLTQRIRVPRRVKRRGSWHPALVFVYGFAVFIALGTLVLILPVSSAADQWTPPIDALFTATSAVCVTGLAVLDTGTYWSPFGQLVILALIQVGGFGFMVSSTLLMLVRREASLRERLLLREALGSGNLGSVYHLARTVIVFTVVVEAAGAIILSIAFLSDMDLPQAVWWGIFHAVSGFNNAGFDLVGGFRSLTPYNQRPVILLTVAAMFMIGGIGYPFVQDVVKRRRFVRLSLDSKLVAVTTAALVVVGTGGLLVSEWANPATLGGMSPATKLLNAFFMGVTPRTAGFDSVGVSALTDNSLIILLVLMFIGGAAGSTAGGIKVQTFSLLLFAIVSAVRGGSEVEAFDRRVPGGSVLRAIAVVLLSLAVLYLVSFALTVTDEIRYPYLLFETFSAFGTTGLSTGITPDLSWAGRLIVSLTMFAGRLGPLTLVVALAAREHHVAFRWPEEGVKIG